MTIREMEPEDLPVALRVINEEGWGYTQPEIERMLRLEPSGSFVYIDKELMGAITTVVHGSIGVIGHLVVSKHARGKGIGRALLKHAIDYLRLRKTDSIIVIATNEGRPLYSKHGFKVEREVLCKHFMIENAHAELPFSKAEPMLRGDLKRVSRIDCELFGDDRLALISLLYDEYPQACYKLVEDKEIVGFSMARKTATGYDFGPWVCRPSAYHAARSLLNATLSACGPGKVYCGLFEENRPAVSITETLPLFKMWSTKLMVLGKSKCYPHIDQVFGIAAFELG